jgi:hypothetical protein
LLRLALDRYRPDARLLHRRPDCTRIGHMILSPPTKGFTQRADSSFTSCPNSRSDRAQCC